VIEERFHSYWWEARSLMAVSMVLKLVRSHIHFEGLHLALGHWVRVAVQQALQLYEAIRFGR